MARTAGMDLMEQLWNSGMSSFTKIQGYDQERGGSKAKFAHLRTDEGTIRRQWDKEAEKYAKQAEADGRHITGYTTIRYQVNGKGGQHKYKGYQVPIWSVKQEPAAAATTPEPEAPVEPEKEMKDITLSQHAQNTNSIVSNWENGGGSYVRGDSPFKSGAQSVYSNNTPGETSSTGEATTFSGATNDIGEPRDNQQGAQDFMSSYKESLKNAMNFQRNL